MKEGAVLGKQINYWMGYKDFLQIAQTALNCGCVIVKTVNKKLVYGKSLDMVTKQESFYYFYVPEAGELTVRSIYGRETIGGYNSSGNVVIEAGFSVQKDDQKLITRSRLYVSTGYYDEHENFIARPDCVTKIYNKLVRMVKKLAPYTELTDTYISTDDSDYLQEKEWKHKEYISPHFLELKLTQNYRLY